MKKYYLILTIIAILYWPNSSSAVDLTNIPYATSTKTWSPNQTNNGWWPALSSDGKYLAYGNWGESWVTDIGSGQNWDFKKPAGLPNGARCVAGQWITESTLTFFCELTNKSMWRYEVKIGEWIPKRTNDDPNLVKGNWIVAKDGHWASYLAGDDSRITKDNALLTDDSPGGTLAISGDSLVHACTNNNTSICYWDGDNLSGTFEIQTPLHSMDLSNDYIVYGGYGPIHGIDPDGKDIDLTATGWQKEYLPQIVMKDGKPWIASSTCTPAPEKCFVMIRPWGERKSIVGGGNGGPASMSVVYTNGNFIVAYANDRGQLSLQTIPASSTRVDLCGSACNDSGNTAQAVNTSGGSPFSPRAIPGIPEGYMGLDQLLALFLNWSKYLLGIAIFVMIFFGGVKWFFSQGNPGQITEAQGIIKNAIIGAILLLSAYLILYTVNPDLINGTFNLPGVKSVPATGTTTPGSGASTICNQRFGGSQAGGCSGNNCVDVSNYTSNHDCSSNGGKCLLSQQAANSLKTFINKFNSLSGSSCSLTISSTIQGSTGPSNSSCHKPGNTDSGTCVDFNLSNYNTCAPIFYQAAKDSGTIVSFLDEYVPACKPSNATGGNIHVNFR